LKGVELNGRPYKNYIDGYNQLDYLTGKVKDSPRDNFVYVNDVGGVVAARVEDWKITFQVMRAQTMALWLEPFEELRASLIFNLRRDPFEKAQHNSNTYYDWWLDHAFAMVPISEMVGEFLKTFIDYPPSQTAGSFNLSKVQKQIEELREPLSN